MENQVSGPLGTDVGSPLDSSQSATEAGQERGPFTVAYAHKSFTPVQETKHRWFNKLRFNASSSIFDTQLEKSFRHPGP